MTPLDSAGKRCESLDQLEKYQVTHGDRRQILIAGKAGMSEQRCAKLVEMARAPRRVFAEQDTLAKLLGARMKQESVIQLAQFDPLTAFADEGAAMRARALPMTGCLTSLRPRASRPGRRWSCGMDTQLMGAVDRGVTDEEADQIISRRNYALGGHAFVEQRGRRSLNCAKRWSLLEISCSLTLFASCR